MSDEVSKRRWDVECRVSVAGHGLAAALDALILAAETRGAAKMKAAAGQVVAVGFSSAAVKSLDPAEVIKGGV